MILPSLNGTFPLITSITRWLSSTHPSTGLRSPVVRHRTTLVTCVATRSSCSI